MENTNNTPACTPVLGADRFYCAATAGLVRLEDDALDLEMAKPISLPCLDDDRVALPTDLRNARLYVVSQRGGE
jgi:hypothetical protein